MGFYEHEYTGSSEKNDTILNYCNYVNYYLKTILLELSIPPKNVLHGGSL
jgi:hypothetical protein